MSRKKSQSTRKNITVDELSSEEVIEEDGFTEGDIAGTPIITFNFNNDTVSDNSQSVVQSTGAPVQLTPEEHLTDNRRLKTKPNNPTPPVDGEPFDIGRFYKIRRSTARMLNELKAAHPDVNVYMNTVVDKAIRHYYNHIFMENGVQK